MPESKHIVAWLLTLLLLSACTPADSLPTERPYAADSNFEVVSDSLIIRQLPLTDVMPVYKGELVVVAEFKVQPEEGADSVWVKVARDQDTMGWVAENELLANVVPADSVSQVVYFFTRPHTVAFLLLFSFVGLGVLYRAWWKKQQKAEWLVRADFAYSWTWLWLVMMTALFYSAARHLSPAAWEWFYYNPSLNPFSLPWLVALFMGGVWGIIVLSLATIDDLFHQLRVEVACCCLLGLLCAGILLYLLIAYCPFLSVSCLLALAVTLGLLFRLTRLLRYRYVCGKCGARMRSKGICPHCGAVNQ